VLEPMSLRLTRPGPLRLGVGGAVLAFVMLAALWLYVPTYQPTDEASHVAYARELSHGRLPAIDTPISSDGDARLARMLRRRDAPHRTIWTANHPPLYYALVAVPLRIGIDTAHPVRGVHAARVLSVGLSALGLVALAYVVLQLAPAGPSSRWRPPGWSRCCRASSASPPGSTTTRWPSSPPRRCWRRVARPGTNGRVWPLRGPARTAPALDGPVRQQRRRRPRPLPLPRPDRGRPGRRRRAARATRRPARGSGRGHAAGDGRGQPLRS
jgi:hypothetical protein